MMMARTKRIYILMIEVNKLFLFFVRRGIFVKVWENSKKLWKHSPGACVTTAFLVLPNFHSCFYLTIRLRARVFYEQIVNKAQPS